MANIWLMSLRRRDMSSSEQETAPVIQKHFPYLLLKTKKKKVLFLNLIKECMYLFLCEYIFI